MARDEESLTVFTCLSSRTGVTDRVPGPLPGFFNWRYQ